MIEGKCKKGWFMLFWCLALLLAAILFTFCHECGHGFGAKLDGTHVSTGFNRVGDAYKYPSDADFRSNSYVQGTINAGSFMGPLVNWVFALLFTVLLVSKRFVNVKLKFLLGICAITNAWLRYGATLWILVAAIFGHVHMEDEVEWSGRSLSSLTFPMKNDEFSALIKSDPKLFLSEPMFYFWPLVSFTISFVCMAVAMKYLLQHCEYMRAWYMKVFLILSPLLITPVWYVIINFLDNVIRINW